MKKFVMMHFGFEKPTPEIMGAWGKWFEKIKDHTVDGGNMGFRGGREISKEGTKDLPMGPDSITGISIIQAEDMAAAEKLAEGNPFIKSLRIYEAMSH